MPPRTVQPTVITAATAAKRTYPHVDEVTDPQAQMTIRLLWDRVTQLTEQVIALQTDRTAVMDQVNQQTHDLSTVEEIAQQALATAEMPVPANQAPNDGGAAPPPTGDDGGEGAAGCAAGLPTGHDSGGLLTAIRAGQIVCGTGNEYPALRAATLSLVVREANMVELLRRMIWHLRLAGFNAGRQRNPSNAISKDKLTVVVNGVLRAYDVFPGVSPLTPLTTQMSETFPANMVEDEGIAD